MRLRILGEMAPNDISSGSRGGSTQPSRARALHGSALDERAGPGTSRIERRELAMRRPTETRRADVLDAVETRVER